MVMGCDPVVDKHTPDAAPGIDAAPDAPSHGMVSVKVYDPNGAGTVVVGVPVVFIEADGTLVGHPTTDSNGVATADVHANASATSVVTTQGETQMTTIVGLQPSDNIIMGTSLASSQDGTFAVSYPAMPGASSYEVVGPCGSYSGNGSAVTLTIYTYCKTATMDLIVVAEDQSGNPIGSIEKPNVAYTAGGTTAITGGYQAISTFNAGYTNVDPGITNISMNRTVPSNIGYGRGTSGTPANGSLQLSITDITGQTASVLSRATKDMSIDLLFDNIAGNTLTYSMDVGASLLPWISSVTPDLAAKKITVVTDTTGTTNDKPDLFYESLSYSRTDGNGNTTNYYWNIVGPTVGDVTLPALPPEIGDVLPKSTDSLGSSFTVELEMSTLTWDMIRPVVFDTLQTLGGAGSGKIRESAYQPRQGVQ